MNTEFCLHSPRFGWPWPLAVQKLQMKKNTVDSPAELPWEKVWTFGACSYLVGIPISQKVWSPTIQQVSKYIKPPCNMTIENDNIWETCAILEGSSFHGTIVGGREGYTSQPEHLPTLHLRARVLQPLILVHPSDATCNSSPSNEVHCFGHSNLIGNIKPAMQLSYDPQTLGCFTPLTYKCNPV